MHWQWGIGGLNKKTLFLLAAVAIVIRLMVMPFALHGDLLYIWSIPTLLIEGVIDPYRWTVDHYRSIAESDWDVYYPPAAYIFSGTWLPILRLFSGGLVDWLIRSRNIIFSLAEHPPGDYLLLRSDLVDTRSDLLILKLPYLIYEITLFLGLMRLLKPKQWMKGLVLWGLNPVVIYSAYMMGQIDLLTAALVVWASVTMVEKKKLASLTLLVIGTMVKVLPIVLIAPMAFLLGKSWKERIFLVLYSAAIFVGFNLPFAHDLNRLRIAYFPPIMPRLFDLSFRPDALVMLGKLIAAAGVGLWLAGRVVRSRRNINTKYFPEIVGLILLLFFSAYRGALFNHYVVLMPFLILFWVKERRAVFKIMVFSGLLFLTHIYTRPLQGELFTPLGIDWLTNFPSSRELVAPRFKYEHLSLLTGAVLSGWMLVEAIARGKRIFNKSL